MKFYTKIVYEILYEILYENFISNFIRNSKFFRTFSSKNRNNESIHISKYLCLQKVTKIITRKVHKN